MNQVSEHQIDKAMPLISEFFVYSPNVRQLITKLSQYYEDFMNGLEPSTVDGQQLESNLVALFSVIVQVLIQYVNVFKSGLPLQNRWQQGTSGLKPIVCKVSRRDRITAINSSIGRIDDLLTVVAKDNHGYNSAELLVVMLQAIQSINDDMEIACNIPAAPASSTVPTPGAAATTFIPDAEMSMCSSVPYGTSYLSDYPEEDMFGLPTFTGLLRSVEGVDDLSFFDDVFADLVTEESKMIEHEARPNNEAGSSSSQASLFESLSQMKVALKEGKRQQNVAFEALKASQCHLDAVEEAANVIEQQMKTLLG